MSMLASFFDICKNSSVLFEGLEIAENQSLCSAWMNQYPTLFLTFKDVDGLTFESAKDMLRAQIAQICNEHDYLLDSKAVSENDKQTFRQLADMVNGRPDDTMLKNSLVLLMRMMQVHYGKSVILLLDEYNVPMAKASAHGYYDQMLEIIRTIMSTALKDNSYLQFAVCCCPHELSLTCLHESSSDCLTFCHQSLQGCRLTTGGNKDYVVMVPSISCSTTYLII